MSNMTYKAALTIGVYPTKGRKDGAMYMDVIPVRAFSVVGGTHRSIDLDSADDISIGNEFEQIRTYKNVTFFIPRTIDFTVAKIFVLRTPTVRSFNFHFDVDIYSDGKETHSLSLYSANAHLHKNPTPVGNKEALLMLEVRFDKVQLIHSKLDADGFTMKSVAI